MNIDELTRIFAELDDEERMLDFFNELFTPKELNDLSLRWELLKELHAGRAQRAIATDHQISLCKITRGSKILKQDDSVTRELLDKYYRKDETA